MSVKGLKAWSGCSRCCVKFKPYDYQLRAIELILRQESVALWLDMGLGKTVATLTALDTLLAMGLSEKTLVIAPKRVAEDTWSKEIRKWEHLRHLSVSSMIGSKKVREDALKKQADVYLINRENTQWLVEQCGREWPFDTVVIDEASSFKSARSKRFKALKKVRPAIKRMVQLTGTPAPNSKLDLWSQLYLLDGGKRLGRTMTNYKDAYFVPGRRDGYIVYEWKERSNAAAEIEAKIADICYAMKQEDWLELPDAVYIDERIGLGKAQKAYDNMARDFLLKVGEENIVASNAAVLAGKLLQFANGAAYSEEGGVLRIHDKKLDTLEEIAEGSGNLLVYYAYKHDLDRLMERFPDAVKLETAEDITAWNAGKIKMLLAHPASAGHGLNLQFGGHRIVWFGLNWSLELYQQANARLRRPGQTKKVIIHHLVAENTIDEEVLDMLQKKERAQDALLEAVKAYV